MVGLSIPELVLIGGIALVVFGPSKLPEVGGAVGKAIREFKKSMQDPEPEQKITVINPQETPKQGDVSTEKPKENDSAH